MSDTKNKIIEECRRISGSAKELEKVSRGDDLAYVYGWIETLNFFIEKLEEALKEAEAK